MDSGIKNGAKNWVAFTGVWSERQNESAENVETIVPK